MSHQGQILIQLGKLFVSLVFFSPFCSNVVLKLLEKCRPRVTSVKSVTEASRGCHRLRAPSLWCPNWLRWSHCPHGVHQHCRRDSCWWGGGTTRGGTARGGTARGGTAQLQWEQLSLWAPACSGRCSPHLIHPAKTSSYQSHLDSQPDPICNWLPYCPFQILSPHCVQCPVCGIHQVHCCTPYPVSLLIGG